MSKLSSRDFNSYCKRFSYSIAHYDINLSLNSYQHKIIADVAVALFPIQSSNTLCFFLAEDCELDRIDYLGISLPHKISTASNGLNLLTVTLPIRPEAGEKIAVNIIYSFDTPPGQESLELSPQAFWYPSSPLPSKYTCSLNVIADESVRVLGPGKFIGTKAAGTKVSNQWVAETPFRGIHVVAGPFLKTTRSSAPPLEVSYPRRLLNQAKAVANYSEELLEFFGETLGPAPFPSLGIILTENAEPKVSSSFFLSTLSHGLFQQLKEEVLGRERYIHQYKLLAQNLARHWLEEHLAVPHPRERWYLKGLAEYSSWLAVEAKYGKSYREKFMVEARKCILDTPKPLLYQRINVFRGQFTLDRAAWLFWICQGLAGESFLPALNETLASITDVAPTAGEFFLALGKHAGSDFSQVFKSWTQPGNQLRLEAVDGQNQKVGDKHWQFGFKLANHGRLHWPYPVPIDLGLEDGSKQRLQLPIQKEPHLLDIKSPVQTLTIDPDLSLLNWSSANEYTF